MNPAFSLYLEFARVIATLLVFVAHSFGFYAPLAEFNDNVKIGRDGVIVFFILSGFVITWCANERDKSLADFTINRASRVYSVAIPGIILGGIASIFAASYLHQDLHYAFAKPWLYLPIYLSFTGNLWFLSETPPSNFPYWSLNFEVWYYLIFAGFFYAPRLVRWILAGSLALLAGPAVLAMFPLWIAGSLLYHCIHRPSLSIRLARVGLVATAVAFLCVKLYAIDTAMDRYNGQLWGTLFADMPAPQQLLGDYLIGTIAVLNFLFAWHAKLEAGEIVSKQIRRVASYSFSFYLFHIPLFTAFHAVITDQHNLMTYGLVVIATTVAIVMLARHTEHKKHLYRSAFRHLAGQIHQRLEKVRTPSG